MVKLIESERKRSQGAVMIHYYGRWYPASVHAIVGKGAWVWFRTTSPHTGSWRKRWVSPARHCVWLKHEWAERALRARGIDFITLGALGQDLYTGTRTVRLADPDFETQALANALDRLAGSFKVDRGTLPTPHTVW